MRPISERRIAISLSPPLAPRLRTRPPHLPDPASGPLDGGWWPRSTDPVAELPGLILALQAHAPPRHRRPVTHILLCTTDWNGRPRRLRVNGPDDTQFIRLGWFNTLPTGLLTAIHADGHRVDLLTVPPAADPTAAATALDLAADVTNRLRTPELLTAFTTDRST